MKEIIVKIEDNDFSLFLEKIKEFICENDLKEDDILIDGLTLKEFEENICSG